MQVVISIIFRYVTMIKGILEETGIYLLSTLNYDKTLNTTGMWKYI